MFYDGCISPFGNVNKNTYVFFGEKDEAKNMSYMKGLTYEEYFGKGKSDTLEKEFLIVSGGCF